MQTMKGLLVSVLAVPMIATTMASALASGSSQMRLVAFTTMCGTLINSTDACVIWVAEVLIALFWSARQARIPWGVMATKRVVIAQAEGYATTHEVCALVSLATVERCAKFRCVFKVKLYNIYIYDRNKLMANLFHFFVLFRLENSFTE